MDALLFAVVATSSNRALISFICLILAKYIHAELTDIQRILIKRRLIVDGILDLLPALCFTMMDVLIALSMRSNSYSAMPRESLQLFLWHYAVYSIVFVGTNFAENAWNIGWNVGDGRTNP